MKNNMKTFVNKHKNTINVVVLIIITAIVLYVSLKDDFSNIVDKIVNANKLYLILALSMVIIYWLVRSLALHNITKKIKKENTYLSSFQLTLRTQFFNAITPFASGGQPYQVYYLIQQGVSPATATNIIIQNFIVYQVALVFLGIVAVIYNFAFNLFTKIELLKQLVMIGFIGNTDIIINPIKEDALVNKLLIEFNKQRNWQNHL